MSSCFLAALPTDNQPTTPVSLDLLSSSHTLTGFRESHWTTGNHGAALSVSLTPGLPEVLVPPLHFIVQPQGVECHQCRFEFFFLKIAKNLLSLCQEIRKRSRQTTKKGNSLQTLPESSQHTHMQQECVGSIPSLKTPTAVFLLSLFSFFF